MREIRLATGLFLFLVAIALSAVMTVPAVRVSAAVTRPRARSSSLQDCNAHGVSRAPHVLWTRIRTSAGKHGIPASFWSDATYRDDIAKIICYESTYDVHAEGPGQYGWFQMSKSLITSEGVSWSEYWSGHRGHAPGWFQCVAGGRYVVHRYSTPVAAWAHEENYGWY